MLICATSFAKYTFFPRKQNLCQTLAVVVISHGIFLTGFTHSFGQVTSDEESLPQEGFSSKISSKLYHFSMNSASNLEKISTLVCRFQRFSIEFNRMSRFCLYDWNFGPQENYSDLFSVLPVCRFHVFVDWFECCCVG